MQKVDSHCRQAIGMDQRWEFQVAFWKAGAAAGQCFFCAEWQEKVSTAPHLSVDFNAQYLSMNSFCCETKASNSGNNEVPADAQSNPVLSAEQVLNVRVSTQAIPMALDLKSTPWLTFTSTESVKKKHVGMLNRGKVFLVCIFCVQFSCRQQYNLSACVPQWTQRKHLL